MVLYIMRGRQLIFPTNRPSILYDSSSSELRINTFNVLFCIVSNEKYDYINASLLIGFIDHPFYILFIENT